MLLVGYCLNDLTIREAGSDGDDLCHRSKICLVGLLRGMRVLGGKWLSVKKPGKALRTPAEPVAEGLLFRSEFGFQGLKVCHSNLAAVDPEHAFGLKA